MHARCSRASSTDDNSSSNAHDGNNNTEITSNVYVVHVCMIRLYTYEQQQEDTNIQISMTSVNRGRPAAGDLRGTALEDKDISTTVGRGLMTCDDPHKRSHDQDSDRVG